jgi:hypothetical protein
MTLLAYLKRVESPRYCVRLDYIQRLIRIS